MNTDLKYEKVNIELRRYKVLELLAKGYNRRSIAEKLNVSDALISLDIQWIREKPKEQLRTHLSEKLPYEFARAMTGINDILRRAHEILDSTKDPKLQHQYMTLIMQLWGTVISLATDGGVIEQAFRKVEGLQGPRSQCQRTNSEEVSVSEKEVEEDVQDNVESAQSKPEE